jgi:hypothetical protein
VRDRRIRGAFIALILTLPALILLATSMTSGSILELLAVEAVVVGGLFFAVRAKAYLQRVPAAVPVRIPIAARSHPERKVRSVA